MAHDPLRVLLPPGTRVVEVSDRGPSPRVGTVVRFARRHTIPTPNPPETTFLDSYIVRWPLPGGGQITQETPAVGLRVVFGPEQG